MHTDTRIILTMSLRPILDAAITAGARVCLALLRSLAGHARRFQTYTKSIAALLGRCPNTVRSYRDQLEEAGFIWWQTSPRTGISTIYIREAVEPPSRRARFDAERREEAKTAPWQGGAQKSAPIKSRPTYLPLYVTRPVDIGTKIAQRKSYAAAIRHAVGRPEAPRDATTQPGLSGWHRHRRD